MSLIYPLNKRLILQWLNTATNHDVKNFSTIQKINLNFLTEEKKLISVTEGNKTYFPYWRGNLIFLTEGTKTCFLKCNRTLKRTTAKCICEVKDKHREGFSEKTTRRSAGQIWEKPVCLAFIVSKLWCFLFDKFLKETSVS